MTEPMVIALIAAFATVFSAGGLWTFIQKKSDRQNAYNHLLMGLAYDKIINRGMLYIQRGTVSKDEYEEYLKYFVEPYKEMGGNGVADRIAKQVGELAFQTLPIKQVVITRNEEYAA